MHRLALVIANDELESETMLEPYFGAEYDWYQYGGRWSGLLEPEYDPEEDPKNMETCTLCDGTGDRPGWVEYHLSDSGGTHHTVAHDKEEVEQVREQWYNEYGIDSITVDRTFTSDWAEECNGCNKCDGTGKAVKWPTGWHSKIGCTTTIDNSTIDLIREVCTWYKDSTTVPVVADSWTDVTIVQLEELLENHLGFNLYVYDLHY